MQDHIQDDRVTWSTGLLFIKCSYSSRLDTPVVTVLPKHRSLWVPRKRLQLLQAQFFMAPINSCATKKYIFVMLQPISSCIIMNTLPSRSKQYIQRSSRNAGYIQSVVKSLELKQIMKYIGFPTSSWGEVLWWTFPPVTSVVLELQIAVVELFSTLTINSVRRYCPRHWYIYIYMWQSRVEIEHYSVAYFDRVAAFKAL